MIFKDILDVHLYHLEHNEIYRSLANNCFDLDNISSVHDLPFISAEMFKEFELKSSTDGQKILRSSGTSGVASSIHVDKHDLFSQVRVLAELFAMRIGRRPWFKKGFFPDLVVGSETMTANQTGTRGFSRFCEQKYCYSALDAECSIGGDLQSPILIFGFSHQIYELFATPQKWHRFIPENSIVLFGGGWKRLSKTFSFGYQDMVSLISERAVSRGLEVIEYYGMIEQTGSVYFRCQAGRFHDSKYSQVVLRDVALRPVPFDSTAPGLIHTMSLLPHGYPGHSLLTADLGVWRQGECSCQRSGCGFELLGRAPDVEIRGCSNVA